jgi:precorrin-6Y C5,15-methyltransferase (decarboxylating)
MPVNVKPVTVVGIGADGWPGLSRDARNAVLRASEIVGSERHLALLPDALASIPSRSLPSPLDPFLEELARDGGDVCVLASGSPMLHGIGATLARRLPPERLIVHPHVSAFALACARLGWPEAEVELLSAVARPPEVVARSLQPGRRLVVYATGVSGAAGIAVAVRERGFGASRFVVMEQLGGPGERIVESTASAWGTTPADPLHAIAIECRVDPGGLVLPRIPGLPDDAFASDGRLTKRHVRAIVLASLQPLPGALLWDVGAGNGSVSIEWLRAEPSARAIAVEADAERAARARLNASALGVPALEVVHGSAPEALHGLPQPDAVFIGGGVSSEGLLAACWEALAPGGVAVANAVTLEGEAALAAARSELGGELTRIELAHAEPLGSLTTWRSRLPIVHWSARK